MFSPSWFIDVDTNTISRDVITTSYTIAVCLFVAYSLTSVSGETGARTLSKQRGKFVEGLDSSGLKGYSGERNCAASCSWNLGKEYVHFTEDGFRDNRAGACCVQKASRSYANVPNVWNDATILRETHICVYTCIRAYTQKSIYIPELHPALLLRYADGQTWRDCWETERERNKQKKRKGKGQIRGRTFQRLHSRGTPLKLFTNERGFFSP